MVKVTWIRRNRLAATLGALAVLLLWLLGMQRDTWVRVSPGPVIDVATSLDLDEAAAESAESGDPVRRGSVAFPTMQADRVSHFTGMWCSTIGDCDAVNISGKSAAGNSTEATHDSLQAADQAATVYASDHVAGYADGAGWPQAPGTLDDLGNVRGPSAGLAVTLYLLELRTAGDLLGDHRVVATGTVDAGGEVGPVGGVDHKGAATAAYDADVFFVPTADLTDAYTAAGVEVVPVENVTDAVAWLCGHGGTGPLCGTAS